MSANRNFRITMILSNFFHDHRNRARIFISDDIQTISDLEDRIKKIFHVTNFHLTTQNEFLPPSEDVRILQQDDIVWAVQNGEKYEASSSAEMITKKTNTKNRSITLAEGSTEEELKSPKKKKKRKLDLDKNKGENVKLPSPQSEEPKKKKRKNKAVVEMSPEEEVNAGDIKMENASTKIKKIKEKVLNENYDKMSTTLEEGLNQSKKDKGNVMKINTLLPVLHSHISTYNKKNSRASKVNASVLASSNVASGNRSESELGDCEKDQYFCKGNLSSYKKSVALPTITDQYLQQKKINIVKIEFVNGSPAQINQLKEGGDNDKRELLNKTLNGSNEQDEPPVRVVREENISASNGASVCPASTTEIPSKSISESVNNETITSIRASDGVSDNFPPMLLSTSDTVVTTKSISEDVKETPADKDCDKENDFPNRNESCCGIAKISSISPIEMSRKSFPNNLISKKSCINDASKTFCTSLNKFSENNIQARQSPQLAKNQASEFSDVDSTEMSVPRTSIVNIITTKEGLLEKDTENNIEKYAPNIETPTCESIKLNSSVATITSNQPNKAGIKLPENLKRGAETSYVMDTFEGTFNCSEDISRIDNSDTSPKMHENNLGMINNTAYENLPTRLMRDSTEFVKNDTNIPLDDSSMIDLDVANSFSSSVSRYSRRKQISGIGQLLEELRSSDSIVSVESVDSDNSEFVTKRHRRRVRRRQKKKQHDNSDTSLNDSSLILTNPITPPKPKPLNVKACPSMHIKFEEGESDDLKIVHKISTVSENESYVENITINSDMEEPKPDMDQIKKEYILNSPSMKGMLPKVGDIIAFMILRITQNYTPEISSYIIGTVTEFNNESKQVVYEILKGLDQCEEPKGKLSMDVHDKINGAKDTKREMNWTCLIDPRLLYP